MMDYDQACQRGLSRCKQNCIKQNGYGLKHVKMYVTKMCGRLPEKARNILFYIDNKGFANRPFREGDN